jgi:hypothetical protein
MILFETDHLYLRVGCHTMRLFDFNHTEGCHPSYPPPLKSLMQFSDGLTHRNVPTPHSLP